MAPKDSSDCVVTVTIELGHQANFLKEPSPEGFTHDWTVFVRGYEGSRLEYFVEKVVFKLHKTFKSPVRVITEPPFRVTESGYAGFIFPIEIHFRNKQTPRKILFSYDLFLNAKDSPPINNVRYEKLKFHNPTPEFKAKLIKAGGTEQGAELVPYDLFGSPVRSEKRALPKIPKDKEKEKEKIKKKKSSPHLKSASPAQSLSSLSSMSSSDDDDDVPPPPPPPPMKKEKEPSIKKESSSSSSQPKDSFSQPKDSSSSSMSSSHKDKSKHRISSSNSSHKERSSSDKDAAHKPHKHKEKDREKHTSTSHKDRDGVKKEKISNSQKIPKEHIEVRKEKEGSLSAGKSSTSSQHDNKIGGQVLQKDREKSLQSKDNNTLSSSSKEKSNISSKEKDKSSSKEKHSSHKDVSPLLSSEKHSSHKDISPLISSEPKKIKDDTGKEKLSQEKDRHSKKIHKRSLEAEQEGDAEKKKLKRSSSVPSTDDRSVKSKSSSGKEKSVSKESKEKEYTKEVKDKSSKSSSSSGKSKHEKSRHSEKHRHSHSSESKLKESSTKHLEVPHKHEKVSKPEILTQSERLALTADFQPQLLLSPLKSKSDEEESPAPSPGHMEDTKLKCSTSNSSPGSQSSAVSCDDANKSDHEMLEPHGDEDKHIVSGLTDSDSDSEEETPYVRSPQKELKSILNKQVQQVTQVNKSSSQKLVRRVSLEEKQKKMDHESPEDNARKPDISYKYNKEERKPNNTGENKSSKTKYLESKMECSDDEVNVGHVSAPEKASDQGCNGLGILAPNGISIGELIAINEKIEKAQADSNQELLDKIIQVIGETDDFDINDISLSFDICSIEKNVVLQIQAVLREY